MQILQVFEKLKFNNNFEAANFILKNHYFCQVILKS